MKNLLLSLLACVLFQSNASAVNMERFTITGDVSKVKHPVKKVIFSYRVAGKEKSDSALVKNNKYTISAEIDEQQLIPISAVYQNPADQTDYRADYVAVRISLGTKAYVSHAALFSNRIVTGSLAEDEFSKIDLELRTGKLDIYKYLKENPDSRIAFDLTMFLFGPRPVPEEMDSLIAGLSERNRNSPTAKKLIQRMSMIKNTAVGNKVPSIEQFDANGKLVRVSDFKGKYVLIEYWVSWCGPCREENPNLVKNYRDYQAKGFEIFGISLDTQKKYWLAAVAKDQITWVNTADLKDANENPAAIAFGISSIPYNCLVDPQGNIIAKNLRGKALSDKLAEIFTGKM